MPNYQIETIESPPFDENSYLIWRAGGTDAVVVDPGFDPQSILDMLETHRLGLAAILNTHGHTDHIAGNRAMKEKFPGAPLIIGRGEAHLLGDPNANLSAKFGVPLTSPDADRLVSGGERIRIADLVFEVREIPGHSPGSVVYVLDEFDPAIVFGGDVLFAGSIGRTDLAGDFELLLKGIRAELFSLADSTVVYPGHGPTTTIAAEKLSNPFVGVRARAFGPR